jgi:hypothetical protein
MQPDAPAWTNWLFHCPWLFVFLFIGQWVLVSYVISLLSGWMELSHRFRDAELHLGLIDSVTYEQKRFERAQALAGPEWNYTLLPR